MASMRPQAGWNSELAKLFLQTTEQVRRLPHEDQTPILALLEQVEQTVTKSSRPFGWHRLYDWWTGGRSELTWSLIHEAQVQLIAVAPSSVLQDLLEIAIDHAQTLPPEDTARERLTQFISSLKGPLSSADLGPAI